VKIYSGYIKPGAVKIAYRRTVVFLIETLAGMAVVSGVMALGGVLCWVAGVG